MADFRELSDAVIALKAYHGLLKRDILETSATKNTDISVDSRVINQVMNVVDGGRRFAQILDHFKDTVEKDTIDKLIKIYYDLGDHPYVSGKIQDMINLEISKNPKEAKKSDTSLGIVQVLPVNITPANRFTDASTLLLTSIPSIEWARSVPFLDIDFILPRPPVDKRGKLSSVSLFKFLLGKKELNTGEEILANASGVENTAAGGTGTTSGMELFTAPQTLVNADEVYDPTVRIAPVIDRFRPLLTFKSLEFTVVPTFGMMSYKSGKMQFVLHDRSRLGEIADLIRPDLYSNTEMMIEYGWSHPDPSTESNPYGALINATRVKEKYGIMNSSFSFGEAGQVDVSLEIFMKGVTDFSTTQITQSKETSEQTAEIEKLLEVVQNSKADLHTNVRTKEVRGSTVLKTPSDVSSALAMDEKARRELNTVISNNYDNPRISADTKELVSALRELYGQKKYTPNVIDRTYYKYEEYPPILGTYGPDAALEDLFADDDARREREVQRAQAEAELDLLERNKRASSQEIRNLFVEEIEDLNKRISDLQAQIDAGLFRATGPDRLTELKKFRDKLQARLDGLLTEEDYNSQLQEKRKRLLATYKEIEITKEEYEEEDRKGNDLIAYRDSDPYTKPETLSTGKIDQLAATLETTFKERMNLDVGEDYPLDLLNDETKKELKFGVNKTHVSLAKLFLKFVGEPLTATGRFDEIQLLFYSFNGGAGLVRHTNVGSFPINIQSFRKQFQKFIRQRKTQNITIREFVEYVSKNFIDNQASPAYGFGTGITSGDYDDDGKLKPLTEKQEVKLEKNIDLRISEMGIEDGKFKMPQVDLYVEALPLGKNPSSVGQRNDNGNDDVTLLRIHIFDKHASAYAALQSLLDAMLDKNLGTFAEAGSEDDDTSKHKELSASIIKRALAAGLIEGPDPLKPGEDPITNQRRYKIVASPERIKKFVSDTAPTLRYGSSTTGLKGVSLTTLQEPLLNTVHMQRSGLVDGSDGPGVDGEIVPLQLLPTELNLDTFGCPLISFGTQFFVDMDTGTSVDNIYGVTGLTHRIEQGKFESKFKMINIDAYGSYRSAINSIRTAIKIIEDDSKDKN